MKKSGLYGLVSMALFCLTSCLGEGGDGITLAAQAAVVDVEKVQLLHLKGGDKVSSETFQKETYDVGECFLVDFSIDYTLAENSETGLKEQGYYTATLSQKIPVEKWPVANMLTDTSTILENERSLSTINQRSAYVKGSFFIFPELNGQLDGVKYTFDMSYDPAMPTLQMEEDQKAYVLYLRTQATDEEATGSASLLIPNAFELKQFVDKIKSKTESGQTEAYVIVRYAKSVDETSGKIAWGTSKPFILPLDGK